MIDATVWRLKGFLASAWMAFRVPPAHRGATVATVGGALCLIFVLVALWHAVYRAGTSQPISVAQALWYAVLVRLWFYLVPGFRSADEFELAVRSGSVVTELTVPGSLLGRRLADDVGRSVHALGFVALPSLVIVLATGVLKLDGSILLSGERLALGVVALAAGYLISFGIGALVGIGILFLKKARGLNELRAALMTVLGGSLVPLSFYPEWVWLAAQWLPFAHVFNTPIGWLVGDPAVGRGAVGAAAVWAVVLTVASRLLLRLARRHIIVDGG